MEKKMQELKTRYREIYDIHSALSVLSWDQNTYMPPAGTEARGRQMSTLGHIAHEKLTDPAVGQLLEDLSGYEKNIPYDSDEAGFLRVVRRQYVNAVRVPPDFIAAFYNHVAQTYQAWVEAREEDNFAKVEPYLEKTLEYSRQYASYFNGYEHIADPLIDRADYGMKASALKKLFVELRRQLVPLVEEVTSYPPTDNSCLLQHFPKEKQIEFGLKVIKKLGFDFERGRQDMAPHPFMTKFAHGDVRITTRINENQLGEALFSSIHETGHALYELGIDSHLEGTPLHDGTSAGVHESQSRLWENIVGRSYGFWTYFYPQLQEVFPSQLGNVTLDQFYRAINRVERSLIRTDADELTYNLHVIIRFDLELAMLEGKLAVKDLPEAWRSRYQSDIGIASPDDKNGVLQDIHWYMDYIGGMFQGYTLGNILSCQFYEAALKACPEIPVQITQGEFGTLHEWLKDNIYRHGSKFTAEEIIERATGSSLTIEPYMNYLRSKYGELYPGK
ncbi:carboxypeptidase M32 [Paenactinomyces guangxiensis]|uniref:Metal-dependent carboxypeptidase n=1 Tax=Paenactinomyces guangxiensis TaxID=1490290 RepID=A0A7W1WPU9_9BACL|nr:carboxypeptidase M32 [Paenactinomyces guangxiensis]MBA4493854.1 carboxypeptidase M32 [Paenactinomyces guangxiensis]MBH8591320.1 carboxypeptidase M32 [Paenactinomyces guangxiensis]